MHWSWKQVRDKWNNMKVKYATKKKKTQVISAFLFYWSWFDEIDEMLGGTTKINGIAKQLIRECILYIHILRFIPLR